MIVPADTFPPGMPPTDHVTAVFELPLTVAVICCWVPRKIVAVAGETLTVTVEVDGGAPLDGEPPALPQRDSIKDERTARNSALKTRKNFSRLRLPGLIAPFLFLLHFTEASSSTEGTRTT